MCALDSKYLEASKVKLKKKRLLRHDKKRYSARLYINIYKKSTYLHDKAEYYIVFFHLLTAKAVNTFSTDLIEVIKCLVRISMLFINRRLQTQIIMKYTFVTPFYVCLSI